MIWGVMEAGSPCHVLQAVPEMHVILMGEALISERAVAT